MLRTWYFLNTWGVFYGLTPHLWLCIFPTTRDNLVPQGRRFMVPILSPATTFAKGSIYTFRSNEWTPPSAWVLPEGGKIKRPISIPVYQFELYTYLVAHAITIPVWTFWRVKYVLFHLKLCKARKKNVPDPVINLNGKMTKNCKSRERSRCQTQTAWITRLANIFKTVSN